MSKRKREEDEEAVNHGGDGEGKRYLFLPDYILKKSNKYLAPPSVMEVTPTTASASTWFSFAARKDYYPIAIRDDSLDRHLTDPSLVVQLTVSLKHSKTRPPYEISAKHSHGIYWFQAVQMHITGILVLTFSCNDESIEPLVFEIPVKKYAQDSDDNEVQEVEEEEEEEVETQQEVIDVDEVEEEVIHEQKRRGRNVQVKEEKKAKAPPAVDRIAVLHEVAYSDKKALPDQKEVAKEYFTSVQLPPMVEPVPPKNRLENNFLSFSYISSGLFNPSNSNVFTIEGRAMAIKIPPCLINAFYHDRTVISPMLLLTTPEENNTKKSRTSSRVEVSESEFLKRTMSPSVHEILEEVERRATHVQNYKVSIEVLRYLFESLLESSLLLEGEREFFHHKITSCEEEKKLLAMEFGPYFFLRFVLCVVHLATPQKGKYFICTSFC